MPRSPAARLLLILIAVFMMTGCSASQDAAARGLSEPSVTVRQPAGQSLAGPSGSVDLNLQIDVHNRASVPITIKRMSLRTLPTGDLQFEGSRDLDERIDPGRTATVDLWVRAANRSGRTDSIEPVQVRGTVVFDSDRGHFRKVFINHVVESYRGGPID